MLKECIKCNSEFETTVVSRRYCENCSPKNNKQVKESFKLKRWIVLIHYGGNPPKCACCDELRYEFLVIDHIEGGGLEHLRQISKENNYKGKAGLMNGEAKFNPRALLTWIIKNNFPEGFRVLCVNCNHSYGHYGYCPHQTGIIQKVPEKLNLECCIKTTNWKGVPSDKPKNNVIIYHSIKNPILKCKKCGGQFKCETHTNKLGFCSPFCYETWRKEERKRLNIRCGKN